MAKTTLDTSGRLDEDLLERFLDYGVRVLSLVEKLERDNRPRRVNDQLTGSGTPPGAHMFEAHDALSTRDFLKCLGGAAKELNETRFWILVCIRMKWQPEERLLPLLDETMQLTSIVKAMNARTRRKTRRK